MGNICTICNHIRRIEMDRALVSGRNVASIAKEYKVSAGSLYHHREHHITRQLATAMQIKSTSESLDILGRIDAILAKTELICQRNFDAGKDGIAIKALTETRSTLELLSKISIAMHSAKMAEEESANENTIEVKNLASQEFRQDIINICTKEERLVLENLMHKIATKDKSLDIFDIGYKRVELQINGQSHFIYRGLMPYEVESSCTDSKPKRTNRTGKEELTKTSTVQMPQEREYNGIKTIPAKEIEYTKKLVISRNR